MGLKKFLELADLYEASSRLLSLTTQLFSALYWPGPGTGVLSGLNLFYLVNPLLAEIALFLANSLSCLSVK